MDAKLIIVGGKANKSQVSVKLPTVIGRSRNADLTVAHPMISRRHCELYEVDGLVTVRDLGSLNGTFVEQKQVSEAALRPGAQFSIGPLTFRIEYEYVGQIAGPPGQDRLAETDEQIGEELEQAAGELGVEERFPEGPVPQGPADLDQTLPIDAQSPPEEARPTIAPPDGQLPDFSAWGGEDLASLDTDTPLSRKRSAKDAPPKESDSAEADQLEKPEPPPPAAPPEAPPAAADEPPAIEQGEAADSGDAPDPAVDQDNADGTPEAETPSDSDSEGPDPDRLSDDEDLDAFLKGLR
jgi:pSer/pThr/pTyr-binding forkhead associated (FHA) protein